LGGYGRKPESSRPAWATKRESVSRKKERKKEKQKENHKKEEIKDRLPYDQDTLLRVFYAEEMKST
jgi:hypothetical protein